MKKLVFAVQVIGLIAMFPIVVILEINHTTRKLIDKDFPAGVTKNVENTITQSTEKLKTQNEAAVFEFPKNMMLLKTAY